MNTADASELIYISTLALSRVTRTFFVPNALLGFTIYFSNATPRPTRTIKAQENVYNVLWRQKKVIDTVKVSTMVKFSLTIEFFALFVAVAARPTNSWVVGEEVGTTSGKYKGHESSVRPGVSEYLGIRYGQETSGARRFANPVPFKSDERLAADKFSLDCPTILSANITGFMSSIASAAQATNPAGEDCLSLNIWTKPQTGEKKKAVMVWVYGGGFNVGTAHDKQFDGSLYADEEDVVLVCTFLELISGTRSLTIF
jgi:hypothetical protein